MLHTALAAGTIDVNHIYSTEILILYPRNNGETFVEIDTHSNRLARVMKKIEDTRPKFTAYVSLVNYGGDGDFYGSWENQIFPMRVQTFRGKEQTVERSLLGVSDVMVANTWQSWINVDNIYGKLYHNTILNNYGYLPNPQFELFNRAIQKGKTFCNGTDIVLLIFHSGGTEEELYQVVDFISSQFRKEAKNPELLHATQTHAENLEKLYNTAKLNRRDIYHY